MMNEPADVDLMLRVKRGDREAFRLLIGRHQKPLLNFIYRFTGNPGESEDLTQEVFLKIFQAAPRYEPQAGFTTWLYRWKEIEPSPWFEQKVMARLDTEPEELKRPLSLPWLRPQWAALIALFIVAGLGSWLMLHRPGRAVEPSHPGGESG